ncbi:MAG: hypothetical protein ACC742_01350 [Thermoanaerobaculales bacterium]
MSADFRAVTLLMVLSLVLIVAPALSSAEENAGVLRVEEASLQLDPVVAGRTVLATFVFHNDGPEDIQIIRAKPS